MAGHEQKKSITFTVNGETYTVGDEYLPATTLLKFLRDSNISVGTKVGCQEGSCGVCMVTITLYDPVSQCTATKAVNACCLLLYSCDGAEIRTIEGLGNTRDGLHPIQDRIAKYNGVQCGYCTPGHVMNMYGLLKTNPKPTMKEIEDAFDSALCRCTGYRPILDAMKSFAKDAHKELGGSVIDVEDLDKVCKKTGKACTGSCHDNLAVEDQGKSLKIDGPAGQWLQPTSLRQLYTLLKENMGKKYRLVFGNTAFGVNKQLGCWNYQVLIDIRAVPELYAIDLTQKDKIVLGANLSIEDLLKLFEGERNGIEKLPYRGAMVEHLKNVASYAIRNVGSWSGNLMLRHSQKKFTSDILLVLEMVQAKLKIGDSFGNSTEYSLSEFLSLDMAGKLIESVVLPKYDETERHVQTYRTAGRLQQSYAYVASGFNFELNPADAIKVISQPVIAFEGLNDKMLRAQKTELFLTNKQLGNQEVLEEALHVLTEEINSMEMQSYVTGSAAYRKQLAVSHFYKFVLSVCAQRCNVRFQSGGDSLTRSVMKASQDYGTADPQIYPVSKPLMKITADNLAAGQVKFTNDLPKVQGQLYASPLLAKQANAKIASIDPSQALKIPGVVTFLQASDIPGENDFRGSGILSGTKDELFCSDRVKFAGQPLGLIVAENEMIAQYALQAIQVTYTDIQEPILNVHQAREKNSFLGIIGPYKKGDAEAAMTTAPLRVKGYSENGHQYHFHLENQIAVCTPTATGGIDVKLSTQCQEIALDSISTVLGLPSSAVTVETECVGGAFGGKIIPTMPVAAMCALAAWSTRTTVKLHMDLNTNMRFQGKRGAYLYEYEVGFNEKGELLALIVNCYKDTGYNRYGEADDKLEWFIDSAYYCPNWSLTVHLCKTNKPISTPMRAPGKAPSIFHMEGIIDHVSTYLKKDPLEVRRVNFFKNGQVCFGGHVIKDSVIAEMVAQHEKDIDLPARIKAVEVFNKENRWRKRGLHVMPNRYAVFFLNQHNYSSMVSIHHNDGSVFVAHGGIEMGQGINTKVIQTCAYKLGIPVDKIRVKNTNTVTSANCAWTAATVTSEVICYGVLKCCEDLLERMAPVKASVGDVSWEELVAKCFAAKVDLTARMRPIIEKEMPEYYYNTWSVCCSEVELDVLTGQYQIRQVDYLYDGGQSLNPAVDMGQLEGAFVMGLGLYLTEELVYDSSTGKLLSDGTWEYKVPMAKDLPLVFNCKFLRNAPNPFGVLRSKAVGETPLSLASSVFFALKRAIEAARAENGKEGWFPLHAPLTVEKIHAACETRLDNLTL